MPSSKVLNYHLWRVEVWTVSVVMFRSVINQVETVKFINVSVAAWRRCVARSRSSLSCSKLHINVGENPRGYSIPLFVVCAQACPCLYLSGRHRAGPRPRVRWTQIQWSRPQKMELPFISPQQLVIHRSRLAFLATATWDYAVEIGQI